MTKPSGNLAGRIFRLKPARGKDPNLLRKAQRTVKREELEFFLDHKGYALGFLEQSSDRTFVAWTLLCKRKADDRVLSILTAGEEPEYVKKQELYRERPYQVQRIEYRRDEPIDIEDEVDDDALIRELHYFRNLDEVADYVSDFGHRLEDIKWLKEINPP